MTDAELAILSLVAEEPRHGYDIQQDIETRGIREWTAIGFSSVYYILNKLEKEGLLESCLGHSQRGPARRVYSITQAGHGILQTTVADLLRTPRNHGAGFSLGLANMRVLRPDQVRDALDEYEASIQDKIAEAQVGGETQRQEHPDSPLHIRAIFDHALRLWQAELEWLREFRAEWEAQAPPPSADSTPPQFPSAAKTLVSQRPTPAKGAPTVDEVDENKRMQVLRKPKRKKDEEGE